MKKIDFFILIFILIVACCFRLYKINTPLADLHSWRQVDTAAVAKNFIKDGFDLLHPRYDDLSSIETGFENPNGYRFVEFPIYNALFAFAFKILPLFSLEAYGRLTSIFFSLIIIAIIYYLALKENSRVTAISSSLIYAIMPFFVFFSRTILPETTATAFALLAIFFLYIYSKKIIWLIISTICFSAAILIKPTTIFFGIPLLYLFFLKFNLNVFKKPHFYLYFILAIVPFLLWRYYISFFPEGVPANSWLITSVNTFEGQKNIFFKPAFFRWIFFERINNYIFGGYLVAFFVLGLLAKPKKLVLCSMLFSSLVYLFVFQGGNVQHEYYQVLILPSLAIFAGLGIDYIVKNKKNLIHPVISYFIIIVIFCLSLFFSFYKVRDYYNYPADLVQIANIVNSLTKENDRIVTDRMGDTTLLYLMNRRGSPSPYKILSDFKKDGYKYFVTLNRDVIEKVKIENNYSSIVFENDKFALFGL